MCKARYRSPKLAGACCAPGARKLNIPCSTRIHMPPPAQSTSRWLVHLPTLHEMQPTSSPGSTGSPRLRRRTRTGTQRRKSAAYWICCRELVEFTSNSRNNTGWSLSFHLSCRTPLHLEQRLLTLHAPTIPSHFAAFSNHPMTRNRDCDRVCGTGSCDSARGARLADGFCHLTVRTRGPEWNRLQVRPHTPLEGSGTNIQW